MNNLSNTYTYRGEDFSTREMTRSVVGRVTPDDSEDPNSSIFTVNAIKLLDYCRKALTQRLRITSSQNTATFQLHRSENLKSRRNTNSVHVKFLTRLTSEFVRHSVVLVVDPQTIFTLV